MLAILSAFILAAAAPSSLAAPVHGPISVVDVFVSGPADVDRLSKAGLNVSNFRPGRATVYATPDELSLLSAWGYGYLPVPPDPASLQPLSDEKALGIYHSYTALTTELQDYAADHADIARLVSLGQSTEGRELWGLLITDNPGEEEDEPEFKYVSTMHGDEPVGTEMLMYLIDRLLNGYGTEQRITRLVNETAIWIVPLMNPDGYVARTRYNAQELDLNRSFPDWPEEYTGTIYDGSPLDTAGRPPEVARIMEWTADNSFVLSANFHTGAILVNYPYDDDGLPSGVYAASPDDDLFIDISLRYSSLNTPMFTNPNDPDSPSNPDGITNGTAWYIAEGSMQDWNYRYAGVNEVTIELWDVKWPIASVLDNLWADNDESMLAYLESVHIGVRGLVTDAASGDPVYAVVTVAGNSHPVYTDPDVGDYHRMLLPGTYTLTFDAPGYPAVTVPNVVVGAGDATRLDVSLTRNNASADVNQDSAVNAVDVQLVVNAVLGVDIGGLDADVDDSGSVNAVDVQAVVNAVLE